MLALWAKALPVKATSSRPAVARATRAARRVAEIRLSNVNIVAAVCGREGVSQ
jgi:hypothetical protein